MFRDASTHPSVLFALEIPAYPSSASCPQPCYLSHPFVPLLPLKSHGLCLFLVRLKAASPSGDVISTVDRSCMASICASQNLILILLLQPTVRALKKSMPKFFICISASRMTESFITNGDIEFRGLRGKNTSQFV